MKSKSWAAKSSLSNQLTSILQNQLSPLDVISYPWEDLSWGTKRGRSEPLLLFLFSNRRTMNWRAIKIQGSIQSTQARREADKYGGGNFKKKLMQEKKPSWRTQAWEKWPWTTMEDHGSSGHGRSKHGINDHGLVGQGRRNHGRSWEEAWESSWEASRPTSSL